MNMLKKAIIGCICLSTSLKADWDPSFFLQEHANPTTILNNSDYIKLKKNIIQALKNSWDSKDKISLLMDLTLLTQPKVCVEIGAFTGSSVLPVAAALKYLRSGKMIAIDAWSNLEAIKYLAYNDPNRPWWSQVDMDTVHWSFYDTIITWSLESFCIEICKPSEQAIDDITDEIDFLHLDGDYSETGSLRDVELYLPKVKPGGYILLSNLYVMVNGKQPKAKTFTKLLESCDVIDEIDNGNTYLLRKNIELSELPSFKDSALSKEADDASKSYVVGSLLGRLGNQMFEIAAASALAWDHEAEACFPELSPSSKEYLHIFFRCNRTLPKTPIAFEWGTDSALEYQPIPYQPNMKLAGYLQNERYFKHHRNKILELFAPYPSDLQYIQRKYGEILSHPKSVCVHVRHYYGEVPDIDYFIQYDKEYYEKAMALFPDDSLFVVISDNMVFAKENIPCSGKNVIFIEKEPFYIDFYLQTLCKNNIISNSSFSWWGAWLNKNENKKVIRPKEWIKGFPDMEGPGDWIKVEAKSYQEKLKNSLKNHPNEKKVFCKTHDM